MLDGIVQLFREGGICVYAIVGVGILLYALLIHRAVSPRSVTRPHVTKQLENQDAMRGRMALQKIPDSALRTPHSYHPHLIRALIAVAPLLGLLGTVNGMIATFDGLTSAGASASRIGAGVSEALITTQLGLTVAAPALLIECLLSRRAKKLREAA